MVHDFGLVAGDEDGLGGRELPGIAHNPVDDGLSADGQQALGQVVGVGAHALALAGNGQNDLHIIPSSGLLEFSKQQQYCGTNVEKCLQLCEGRLRQTGSAAPRKEGRAPCFWLVRDVVSGAGMLNGPDGGKPAAWTRENGSVVG